MIASGPNAQSGQPRPLPALALLALITVVGAALRFYQLGATPRGLYQDEAFNGLDALGVIAGDRPLYFPANNGREPAYIYLASLSVAALGRTPLAERLPAAVIGTLLIPAVYALGTALYHRRLGLWAAAVVAFTFWPVALSRLGLRAGALPLVAALALACAAHGYRRNKLRWVALGGALYGLTFYTYLASRFTPVVLLALAILWYSARRPTFPNRGQIAAFALAAALAVAPLALTALRYPELLTGRVGQVSVLNPAINGGRLVGTLLNNTLAALGLFNWRGDDIARHNLPGRPAFDPALGLAFLLGVGVAGRGALKHRRAALALPLLWVGIMLLPTILAEDTPHFLRAVGVWPLLAVLPALGLDAVWTMLWPPIGPVLRRGLPLAALAVALALTTRDYFLVYAPAADTSYLFQAAATELAEQTNTYLAGDPARRVIVDRRYWDSFASVRFLLAPSDRLSWYTEGEPGAPSATPFRLVAWPYLGLETAVQRLPERALITPERGPLHRDDLQPEPYALYTTYTAEPCAPATCGGPALAVFANGIALLRAETARANASAGLTETLTLMLTWSAAASLTAPVQVYAQAWAGATPLAQADGPLGTELFPSQWWPREAVVREQRKFVLQLEAAQVPVTLRVGLYDPITLDRVPRADPAAEAGQTDVAIAP
ncbi:MAG: glycosyltransferase family 39 protein [Anaerolineales bacterium]|nr:glycosyltransferase family 39 protein [Anaerolineales bacterium]